MVENREVWYFVFLFKRGKDLRNLRVRVEVKVLGERVVDILFAYCCYLGFVLVY